jgi:acyl-coenzyme A thioesterase PaaI-like protein
MNKTAFQDLGSVAGCYGCGPDNTHGLQLKSYWDGEDSIATFNPQPYHCAGQPHFVYGGLLASLLDCHSVNLAIAHAYKTEQREIGSMPKIFYVTAQLNVRFIAATPIDAPLSLRATLKAALGRKSTVAASIHSGELLCVTAEVLAVRVGGRSE